MVHQRQPTKVVHENQGEVVHQRQPTQVVYEKRENFFYRHCCCNCTVTCKYFSEINDFFLYCKDINEQNTL